MNTTSGATALPSVASGTENSTNNATSTSNTATAVAPGSNKTVVNAAGTTSASSATTGAGSTAGSSTAANSNGNRPVHPAVLTTFGPGKGSGASEYSCWAYLTRPRPANNAFGGEVPRSHSYDNSNGNFNENFNDDSNDNSKDILTSNGENDGTSSPPLPNLVTAQANSLRVYTVLPNAGTLALTAVYDNLAGTICSLDVIPNGTGGGLSCDGSNCGAVAGDVDHVVDHDADVDANGTEGTQIKLEDENIPREEQASKPTGRNGDEELFQNLARTNCACCYDGLLLGFAGHPRLSLVYPSTPMVGGGCWNKDVVEGNDDDHGTNSTWDSGVGQGGVLLASSIVDLTPALIELSMGGTSYLEQDIFVSVSTASTVASGVCLREDGQRARYHHSKGEMTDPSVAVVLGGGVAMASFSLPKASRPDDSLSSSSNPTGNSLWWRVASEPFILPLPSLASKIRSDYGGGGGTVGIPAIPHPAIAALGSAMGGAGATGIIASNALLTSNAMKNQGLSMLATMTTVGGGPILGHGFGDILDIAFLSGYTEPTLLVLHSNPKRGGGRAWAGRLGRTTDIPLSSGSGSGSNAGDGNDHEDDGKYVPPESIPTGTKYGLTLTAISLAIHQRRAVVLWSLLDALPADSWKIIPHPSDGALVWGVNVIVYISMGGKIQCSLAVNGFAKIGCPTGLLPLNAPVSSTSSTSSTSLPSSLSSSSFARRRRNLTSVHLEPNPIPLPTLSLQLDGARVSFVTEDVALVCLGNGFLHSLELHRYLGRGGRSATSFSSSSSMFLSLSPLGHRVGGLGVTSCLSVLATACHSNCFNRYLPDDGNYVGNGNSAKKLKKESGNNDLIQKVDVATSKEIPSGPKIQARGLVFVGSRMGDCTLLAFSLNEATPLVLTDVDAEKNEIDDAEQKSDDLKPDVLSSISGPPSKRRKTEEDAKTEIIENSNKHSANVTIVADSDGQGADSKNTHQSSLPEEEILRLEEEELYHLGPDEDDMDGMAPSLVSPSRESDDSDDGYGDPFALHQKDDDSKTKNISSLRRTARFLSMFRTVRALDSLTGLGPLGPGCYGPVATCPSLTGVVDGMVASSSAAVATSDAQASIFSDAFSSAARHYIMPCGFGTSGGLAVVTTPGRDNVGGSILCEADLCNMAGAIFGLPQSNLVLLGKADGVGSIVLRALVSMEDGVDGGAPRCIEEFEEVDIVSLPAPKGEDSMDVNSNAPSFFNSADVLGKMTLLAATEFSFHPVCSESAKTHTLGSFTIFFVKSTYFEDDPYCIVIMSNDTKEVTTGESSSCVGLRVDFVHRIKAKSPDSFFSESNPRGELSSVTPMVSKVSDQGLICSVTFGCVWISGNASTFNITVDQPNNYATPGSASSLPLSYEVSESIFSGNDLFGENSTTAGGKDDFEFYQSNKIVSMDVISLPYHVFDSSSSATSGEGKCKNRNGGLNPSPIISGADLQDVEDDRPQIPRSVSAPTPDPTSSFSFPPDRLSMHGTWCAQLGTSSGDPPIPLLSQNVILIAVCRRSGDLHIYDNADVSQVDLIEQPSSRTSSSAKDLDLSPVWKARGCGHGVSVLGDSAPGTKIRRPEMHDVEAVEIRFFVSGPSLQPESITKGTSIIDTEKDAWMLRSLCILVDTNLGDLHLYSAAKRRSNKNRLEFSRVPLSCVSRPSEEAGRHFIKLRRKGIISPSANDYFRPNRLHRFCGTSGEDGLFAATSRPLWFVSERGAPTVVSHKSRHVSPAGGRPVPVSGFCAMMPTALKNANKGFLTLHERIGRVGSQRLTLYSGLWDVFAPHGLLPGGGVCIQKVPLGVTVRRIEFINDASISSTSRPMYALLVSRETETDQSHLNDDGLSPEERQRIRDEKEAAKTKKQVEADLGGFDIEQEWVEEIEREDCFEIDVRLGLAPPMATRVYEVWLVDASSEWKVVDKFLLDDFEHGTAMSVLYLTDVVEESDETPRKSLFITVGTGTVDQDGEDLASKGRILLFQVKKAKHHAPGSDKTHPPLELVLTSEKEITLGPVTSLSSLKSEDKFRVVVGAGAEVTVEQWGSGKLTQVGFYHAHMQVQEIILFKTFFLLSDAYDSLHFLVWRESDKSLTLLAKDYEPTQVFAAGLISRGGAMSFVCHDDRQNLQFFQYAPTDAAARGGNKLVCRADFHLGTQTTALRSHWGQSSLLFNSATMSSTLSSLKQQDTLFGRLEDDQRFAVNFGTTDGSFGSIVPLSEPTYWRLTALQSVMSNALESNCALSHRSWRLYRRATRRGGCRSNDRKKGVVDADLVMKFVDLPMPEQEDLASSIGSTVGLVMDNLLELGCAGSVI